MRGRALAAAAVSLLALAAGGPGMSAAQRRDLARDERRGGHTLARHVALSDDQLRDRLRRGEEHRRGLDLQPPRRSWERLARSRDRVRARRSGARPNLTLDYRGVPTRVIGRSLEEGAGHRIRPLALGLDRLLEVEGLGLVVRVLWGGFSASI